MTQQFGRTCLVSLQGSSNLTIPGGGKKDLAIEFSIGASVLQTPNPGHVRIYNPSPQTAAQFKNQEFKTITLLCGWQGNNGLVYSGTIRQSLFAHNDDNVTSYIDIFSGEGDVPYNQATVNQTLQKGWTPQDKVNLALNAMKPYGITGLGFCNVDLSAPARPRGRPFVGMARDLLREVSLTAGATWYISQNQVHILDHSKPVQSDGPIVLNSQTGMVSWGQVTENGVIVRCLINPAIKLNTQIKVDEASINGAEKDISSAAGFGNIGQKSTLR